VRRLAAAVGAALFNAPPRGRRLNGGHRSSRTVTLAAWAVSPSLWASRRTSSAIFSSFPVPVAGKTGTAVDRGESVGWFVGWAPAEAPARAVVVRLQGARGQEAAAVGKELLEAVK